MKPRTSFELWRWIYHVIIFFTGTGLIILIGELLAGPLLRWLFYDIPYHLPTWSRAGRLALGIFSWDFLQAH